MLGDKAIETVWIRRGLMLLFAFGVANMIGALISVVAFNWTYFATPVKLGGIGLLLIACAGLWIQRGFDSPSAISFGIAAQVLIGVWLAAAGQLYQAPGGLQDLLMRWAMLGLPFALASRSQAHWAVWFAVVLLWALSPMGVALSEHLTYDQRWIIALIGAAIAATGLIARYVRDESGWLETALAVMTAFLLVVMSGTQWADVTLIDGLALLACAGLAFLHYRRSKAAGTVIFLTAIAFIVLMELLELLGGFDLLEFFVLGAYTLAATYGLVKVGLHMTAKEEAETPQVEAAASQPPWYLDTIAALGGILSAIFLGGFVGAFIALSAIMENVWYYICLFLGLGLWVMTLLIRPKLSGVFSKTFVGMFTLGGIGLLIVGIMGVFGENDIGNEIIAGGVAAIVISLLSGWRVRRDSLFTGLMALLFIAGLAMLVFELTDGLRHTQQALIIYVLCAVIGACLAVTPIDGRIRPSLPALFLLASFVFVIVSRVDIGANSLPEYWFIDLGVLAVGMAILHVGKLPRPSWPVLAACFVFVLLLPTGAAAALLLLLFGYGLRNIGLFGFGAFLAAILMLDRYFGIEQTLLVVAAYMAATGIVLLGLWTLSRHRLEAAA